MTNLHRVPELGLCVHCGTVGNATAMSVAPCVSWQTAHCWNVNSVHTQTLHPPELSDQEEGVTVPPAGFGAKDKKKKKVLFRLFQF